MHAIVIIIITREDKTRELIFHIGPIPRACTICSRFPPKIPVISQKVPQKKVFVTKVVKKKIQFFCCPPSLLGLMQKLQIVQQK